MSSQPTTQLLVDRDDIGSTRIAESMCTVGEGEFLVEVERFALTSNNVTYAVMGEQLQYWQFFPTEVEGHGIVPAWGVGTVVASRHEDVGLGERLYGYLPMGSHVVLRPDRVGPVEVVDASPHRTDLAGAYQRYMRLEADPLHDDATTDLELLYRPLFTTAFLLAEVVAGDADEPHDVVVITSASSKTGAALAHLLRDRDVTVVGVTSAGNVEHVTATRRWDRVLAYDELEELGDLTGRAAVVDLAGRPDVVAKGVDALPDPATHLIVGATHHDAGVQPTAPAEGAPEPTFFFAPTHAATLARAWGPPVLLQRIADAWHPFVAAITDEVEVAELDGLAAAAEAWRDLVGGDVDPGVGLVVALD